MKVLDLNGRELRIGSRVIRTAERDQLVGIVTWVGREVDVTFVNAYMATYQTKRRRLFSRTRICPQLISYEAT